MRKGGSVQSEHLIEVASAHVGAPTLTTSCWGKSQPDGAKHPLVDHCLDVAIVLRALLDLDNLARLGITDARHKDRLAVIAFFHDFGKCNRGFQAKADPTARETAGHVLEAVALLCDLSDRWPPAWRSLLANICGWFANEEQAFQMLLASISHHGRPVSENDYRASGVDRAAKRWWSAANGYDPLSALDALAHAARHAFPAAFAPDAPPIDATAAMQQRFAGLLMLADWIGSDTQFFPYRQSPQEDRPALARSAAARALQAIGLKPPEPRTSPAFAQVFGFSPTPLQAALAEQMSPNDDNRLLLVESDTGSGKTEAALAWFFRLYAAGKVDGLYFALPTRVAARELYARVRRAVEAAFEPDRRPGPVLLAAPGYVQIDGRPVLDILADPQAALWDDNTQDRRRERLWSAERPKRFLAAPIAVGTIDQALLSVLQVKHSLMRSVCLDRHLLVVDEVHASDPYMREVLRALLRGHLARGGWTLLLSATLGEAAAAAYFDRDTLGLDAAIAKPYPLLSAHSRTWPMPAARQRTIEVELSPTLADDSALIPRLIAALELGARVLVVCNTVARANALFRQVESQLQAHQPALLSALFALNGVPCPHHGRFAREDREILDAAVTTQLGKNAPGGAKLLIGTQTLEQSLDIDADWLITDLAPMDVLIQRFGRLHRHTRSDRPSAHASPKALVRVPPQALDDYLDARGALRAPAGLGNVYADGRVLARTWENLQHQPTLALPRQARERIERTTHPEALDALSEAWCTHGQQLAGQVQAEIAQALRSVMDGEPFGDLHYTDKSERVLTRLGRPTYEVALAHPLPSPFGASIHRVAIPSHWLSAGQVPESVCAEPTDAGFRFAVGEIHFRYTRFGLEKDDA
jgi:CRISPR-associated endonuclease/helicase Cas3